MLIPSKYGERGESVIIRIADDDGHLPVIVDLDHATNDRLLSRNDRVPDIGVDEPVFGVPHHHIINAAFSHAHPVGGRFNGPGRGAWYAGFEIETSQAEVAWHKSIKLAEYRLEGGKRHPRRPSRGLRRGVPRHSGGRGLRQVP